MQCSPTTNEKGHQEVLGQGMAPTLNFVNNQQNSHQHTNKQTSKQTAAKTNFLLGTQIRRIYRNDITPKKKKRCSTSFFLKKKILERWCLFMHLSHEKAPLRRLKSIRKGEGRIQVTVALSR